MRSLMAELNYRGLKKDVVGKLGMTNDEITQVSPQAFLPLKLLKRESHARIIGRLPFESALGMQRHSLNERATGVHEESFLIVIKNLLALALPEHVAFDDPFSSLFSLTSLESLGNTRISETSRDLFSSRSLELMSGENKQF